MSGFNLSLKERIEPVKWLLGAGINNTYQPVADVSGKTFTANPTRQFLIQNGTDGDVMVSFDGVNDHFPVFKGAFVLLDVTSNRAEPAGSFAIQQGSTFYVTQLNAAGGGAFTGLYTNPTTGAVFVTTFYGA